ncbi:MAG: hypothetical protein A2W61_07355 [Deltaproteobacteria bacterium RIFCSPLOWO2_01_44_7]|nr:MAG: hypothetical protein A2712_08010 [Deltaproteobacteria bacterium RIFCSPHIGHO2_01_FULL_43_49]OGQ14718.1 MAG: hypothetical protein A3D22_08990 [Deltaproteobacteria bacterium RIFCSPHIGHO2_02_FULL_44_53]OGQ28104.1 MAG: hypothetical protein A3D98_07700 [Deltaproteobacteria bacterium RIFCSPHIGHO2_12_FULL_44_21]OGQ31316.1 MAG: hypothetical protein A2979_07750 [Deltaproteobacteria bacterium RIFCSPLOWO2_01_FULL_45_74]OGQ40805.1 MAG: hypothetical protein A2W61_07355 [Deltaproteobacteria bacterium 
MDYADGVKKMTKKEGKAYLKRWREVRSILAKEWQRPSLAERFKEFLFLLDNWSFFSSYEKGVKRGNISNNWARLRRRVQHG